MDVESIHQSHGDYVLYRLCPIAYSRRYRGLKDPGTLVRAGARARVASQWVMTTTGSPYWSAELEEGCETESHSPVSAQQRFRCEEVYVELGEREGWRLGRVATVCLLK